MAEVRIVAEPRTEFGKGPARRTRRAGKVPAVVYGHGRNPVHIALPGHDLMRALKTPNVLLSLDLDGASELVLPKAVQRDPIKGFLEHVDLVLVRRGEKVTVEIPVTLSGNATPDTLVDQQLVTLAVEAEATHIPAGVEVSIEGLVVGQHIIAADVVLPEGTTLVTDGDHIVVQGLAAPTAEQLDAELAEAEAEAGIEREATDEEQAAAAAPEAEAGDSADAPESGAGQAPPPQA
ncbi:MAG: 50S ribosomal protein L25/general stress protein Ctc [Actinomycetota bacterium]|nr:50S ribosomal protein L25/general stress protein Ctc [Actinomycetota bacterium]